MTALKPGGFDAKSVVVEPLRLSVGTVFFIASLILPAVAAVGIYLGAWVVASDVYAARDAQGASLNGQNESGFAAAADDGVAGWKKALVGICPAH